MGFRKLLVVAFLLGVTVAAGAAIQDTRTIQIGGQDTITASVSNPLNVPDRLRVEFDGPAVTNGLIDVQLPETGERTTCFEQQNACEVYLDGDQERDITFTVTGERAGEDDFMVTVSSETTGKRAEASLHVTVEEEGGDGGFMAFLERLLGIT